MIWLLDSETVASIPVIGGSGTDPFGPGCRCGERCGHSAGSAGSAFRPDPQLDGNLRVDPEIHLPSPGMDVDISYYHNGISFYNGPFGYKRTINLNMRSMASGSPVVVTLIRTSTCQKPWQIDPEPQPVAQIVPPSLSPTAKILRYIESWEDRWAEMLAGVLCGTNRVWCRTHV